MEGGVLDNTRSFPLVLMGTNKRNNHSSHNSHSSSYNEGSRTRRDSKNSAGEKGLFSSTPFFLSLRAFVRRGTGAVGDGDGDGHDNATATFCSAAASLKKPANATCLSPEVLGRLRFVGDAAADAKRQQLERPPAIAAATAETPARGKEAPLLGEDGRIEWSLVRISADDEGSEGEEKALAEGARLAVVCHAALQRNHQQLLQHQHNHHQQQQQRSSPPPPLPLPQEEENERMQTMWAERHSYERAAPGLPFAEALPGVMERIVGAESKDEEVYVALCVCLTILERALYDIYRQGASTSSRKMKSTGGERGLGGGVGGGVGAPEGRSDGSKEAEGVGERGASVGAAPVMILRDLIATPEIKSALPEKMLTVLRLLLLPMGFNIRNLVVSFYCRLDRHTHYSI